MSRIDILLEQILAAIYGRDVRQSIHDAISECYDDVSNAKTLADQAISQAETMATNAEERVNNAINDVQIETQTSIGACTAATTTAITAASDASTKAVAAEEATTRIIQAFSDLQLSFVDGKLCVNVERSD